MKTYTFFFFRPDNPIPSFDIAACADDDEARSWGPRLAGARPHCHRMEVWDERTLVHQVCWDGPPRSGDGDDRPVTRPNWRAFG
jgi:hypothetical protein